MAIVPNQSNMKVHFAAAESVNFSRIANKAGVNYFLFTVFPLICEKFGIKHYQPPVSGISIPSYIESYSNHTIMDSGLFTLMFGSHKGDKDEKFIDRWYSELVNFVGESNYGGTCVEVDCQKVLGTEKAWSLRERMKLDLPNNRQINVFHIEDGQKGLDRMIEFSDYIALSVPELRHLGKKDYLVRLTNYIKNKKPSIDIHLLGMTEKKLLKDLNFASSCDSTSWLSPPLYGSIGDSQFGKFNINHSTLETLDQYKEIVLETLDEMKIKHSFNQNVTDARMLTYLRIALCADYHKKVYQSYAGSQD